MRGLGISHVGGKSCNQFRLNRVLIDEREHIKGGEPWRISPG